MKQWFDRYSRLDQMWKMRGKWSPEQIAEMEKKMKMFKNKFETNVALLASNNRRKDVEQEASKSMAERIFQDVDALISPEQGNAEKWKIIPQKINGNPPFAIDAKWNISMSFSFDKHSHRSIM
jgi:hypothetical protein